MLARRGRHLPSALPVRAARPARDPLRGPSTPLEVWALLPERLACLPDGGIDWTRRPFAKRWSARRLGRAGVLELAATLVVGRGACFLVDPSGGVERTTVRAGLTRALSAEGEAQRWLVSARGDWVMELDAERTFSCELLDARHTRMLRRLQALERTWGRGPQGPVREQPPWRAAAGDTGCGGDA